MAIVAIKNRSLLRPKLAYLKYMSPKAINRGTARVGVSGQNVKVYLWWGKWALDSLQKRIDITEQKVK